MLAEAVEAATEDPGDLEASLCRAARRNGTEIGAEARRDDATPEEAMQRLAGVLERYGYEPGTDAAWMVLLNCPFHALVEEHRQLTCSMNHQVLAAAAACAAGLSESTACLDPAPDRCCVRLLAEPPDATRVRRNPRQGGSPRSEL
ncbi:MAG: hypothetical protein ACRDYB_05980 [Acidimicrobiales bacterium]